MEELYKKKCFVDIFEPASCSKSNRGDTSLCFTKQLEPCVRTNFLARVLCSLAAEEACFRKRVTHGVVLVRSLVIHVCVSECFWNGSGVHPYLLVQKKLFRQSTQNAGLCPAVLQGQFFSDSAFYLLRKLCDIFLVNSRNGRVSWLAVPRIFLLCFSCNGCQRSFVSQGCHFLKGKCYAVMKTELFSIC